MAAPWTPTHADVDYTSSGVTAAPTERANVFVPDGSAPAGGWPVLVWIEETALDSGARQTSIASSTAIGHQCLAHGIAFVSATVTRVAASGPESVTGKGMFSRPGQARWADAAYPSAWKSAIHLVQWAKADAATYGFNAALVSIGGSGIGADLALWAGAGPSWPAIAGAALFRAGVSHRAAGVVAFGPTGWFEAVQVARTVVGFAELGDIDTIATDIGDCDPADLLAASPLRACFDEATYSGIRALSAAQPVMVWTSGAVGSTEFGVVSNLPAIGDGTLPVLSDAWGAHMLRRQFLGISSAAYYFHLRNSQGLHSARYADATGYPTEILSDDADAPRRAAAWLRGLADGTPPVDPVAERVVRNLMAVLKTPQVGAGYWHTVHQVRRGPALAPVASLTLPTVYVTSLGTESEGTGRDQTNTIEKTMRAEVLGLIQSNASDAPSQIERLAFDLETAIYTDRTMGGLAIETIVGDIEPVLPAEGNTPIYGVALSVEIQFRTPSTDLLTPK